MKNSLFLFFAIFISWSASPQNITTFADNFESYTTGDYIAAENPTWWKTWNNLPGTYEDGLISADQASSGTRSVRVDDNGGLTDLVLKLGDRTTGKYDLKWMMYFQPGCGGHYNIQHFEATGIEWALQMWFSSDGTGWLETGTGPNHNFTYPPGTWFQVTHNIDLDNDWIRLTVNGVVIHEWPFSYQVGSTSGTNQLGCVDFYATSGNPSAAKYYFDDLYLIQIKPGGFYTDNFESYAMGAYIAAENPAWWKTWNNLPGTYEDGLISADQASSGTRSVRVDDNGGLTDLVLKLGDRTTGKYDLKWMMYFQPGCGGHYNIQHFEATGIEWALQMWFSSDGTGWLETGTGPNHNFTYPPGTWFQVTHNIDLDNDWIRLTVNGVVIHEWPFSYQVGSTSGTNQLGCVDFYAASGNPSAAWFYIDDLDYYKKYPAAFYTDAFESYASGEYIAAHNPQWWKTWNNLPGTYEDGLISADQASSGTHSVRVDDNGGLTDLVLKLGDRTSGKYDLNWMMFFQPGCGGHYNIQHFEATGVEWAFQVWFSSDGTGRLEAGVPPAYNFTYPPGTWFPVNHLVDLDNDWIKLTINGVVVHEWPFSFQPGANSGINQLGCVDFYAASGNPSAAKYYFDDLYFLPAGAAVIPLSNWPVLLALGLIALLTVFMVIRRR